MKKHIPILLTVALLTACGEIESTDEIATDMKITSESTSVENTELEETSVTSETESIVSSETNLSDYEKINNISKLCIADAAANSEISEYVISGYSINAAFSQLQPYATGDAEKSLSSLTTGLTVEDSNFKSANLFIIDDTLELNATETDKFVREDLQDNSIVEYVNTFTNDNTEGLISELITSPFREDIKATVLNAVYFKGTWSNVFNEDMTSKDIFHAKSGDVEREFMNKHTNFKYNGSDMIELKYEDSNFVMDIIKDVNDIDKRFEEYLNEVDNSNLASTDIILKLPKFEVAIDTDVKTILENAGYTDIFDGDYSKLANDITIDDAMQRAKITVNEKGTEAAAVTIIGMKANSALPAKQPVEFIVDSQFLYIIRDTETNAIMFAGFVR